MTIEQEFFKAFGIEYKWCARLLHNNEILNIFDTELQAKRYYSHNISRKGYVIEKTYYQPITPEIVLKLEEILFKKDFSITYSLQKDEYLYSLWKTHETLLAVEGITRIDALLKLCIQLKHEIQDQVKELFNAN